MREGPSGMFSSSSSSCGSEVCELGGVCVLEREIESVCVRESEAVRESVCVC